MLIIFLVAFSCSSCDDDEPEEPKVEVFNHRTVLVYMVAENSLYSFVNGTSDYIGDLTEMLSGCKDIPDSCELVVYLDDLKKPRIYTINNKTTARSGLNLVPELQYDDDNNSASPEVLNNILHYVTTKHKAKSYGLVMWSHGSGWIEGKNDVSQTRDRNGKKTSFGVDNLKNTSSDNGLEMNIEDMASVLEQYDIDFLLFDACFMQTIETLFTLRNSAKYIIGSPTEIPGLGAPYDRIMAPMFADPLQPTEIAKKYYDYYWYEDKIYKGVLLSVVNTSELDNFALATKTALQNIDLRIGSYQNVMNYFLYDYWRHRAAMPDFYDMKGIMQNNIHDSNYISWQNALDKLTLAKYATKTWYSNYSHCDFYVDSCQYSGISMYVPFQKYIDNNEYFTSGYYKTDWYKAVFAEKKNK